MGREAVGKDLNFRAADLQSMYHTAAVPEHQGLDVGIAWHSSLGLGIGSESKCWLL